MRISEILDASEAFPTVATDDTVQMAAQCMRDKDVRAVPVVEGDKLLGILTDWDIVVATAHRASEIAEMPVSAVMTHDDLVTIDASASVADATAKLQTRRVHHLPVLSDGRYVGMICLGLEWSQEDMLTPPLRPTLTARHP